MGGLELEGSDFGIVETLHARGRGYKTYDRITGRFRYYCHNAERSEMSLLGTVAIGLVVALSLWMYFGFVYFDLEEFKPASRLKRGWSVIVALAFPAFALCAGTNVSDKTRLILSGIGVTTILVPAIIPDLEPKPSSVREWLYFKTIGKLFADLVETGIVYGIAILGSAFGSFWVAGYGGIAMWLAIGRSMWIRLQPDESPRIAKPNLLSILVVAPIVVGWVWLIVDAVKLKPNNWNIEFSELYKPQLETALWAWLLGRWPWVVHFRISRKH
jgi:hypothetical protein